MYYEIEKMERTLQFFHQYFLLSLPALASNWEAPACNASVHQRVKSKNKKPKLM